MSNTSLVAVVLLIPVLLLLAFLTVAPRTRRMERLRVAVLGTILLAFVGVMVVDLAEIPTALVCERGRTNVEATPTIEGGRFEEYRVGPCVFFNPESRGPGGQVAD